MNLSGRRVARLLGEFAGLAAIIFGGSFVTIWASDAFTPPVSDAVNGLAILATASVGFAWLLWIGPRVERERSSVLAGLGGAVGYLAFNLYFADPALGAAFGAGAFAFAGILWNQRDSQDGGGD